MTSPMRLAWLSPYGRRSDVSAFSKALLTQILATEGATFDPMLFVNEHGPSYGTPLPRMMIPREPISELLGRYDAAVFNMGNNIENHGMVLEAMRRMPGIVIMHDFSFHHLFAWLCFERHRSPAAYARIMHDWGGKQGFDIGLSSGAATAERTRYAPWDSDHVAAVPLSSPITSLASAVIVHSDYAEQEVRKTFHGPVWKLFLPADQKVALSPAQIELWQTETQQRDRCEFVVFGHVSRSKCIELVLHAFSLSEVLREGARLRIAGFPGDPAYVGELEELIEQAGLEASVKIELAVSDQRLHELKDRADVFVNLRWPNTEGASGSLTEQLGTGRPVVAYRSGCYAEVPIDAIVHIDREQGLPALIRALEQLAAAPASRVAIGSRALKWLQSRTSLDYVRRLGELISGERDLLARRARHIAPARSVRPVKKDIDKRDREWLAGLTKARRAFDELESDADVYSPEPFLLWGAKDLERFIGKVILPVDERPQAWAVLGRIVGSCDRWELYEEICRIRLHMRLQVGEAASGRLQRSTRPLFWMIAGVLSPDVQAKLLYSGSLARLAGEESRFWTTRLEAIGGISCVLCEFLDSAEYREGFPDRAMDAVRDWAETENDIAEADAADMLAPLAPGESLEFTSQQAGTRALLRGGWHPSETFGTWSASRVAKVRIAIKADEDQRLRIRLRLPGDAHERRALRVFYGNVRLCEVEKLSNQDIELILPLPSASFERGPVAILRFELDSAHQPAAAGLSDDQRWLGINLQSVELMAEAAESSKPGPAMLIAPTNSPVRALK